MALLKNITISGSYQFTWESGSTTTESDSFYEIKDCYIKVESINGNKQKIRITVHCKGDGIVVEKFYSFTPSTDNDSENFIKQAYEYLKTLPEFADATDC